MLLFCPNCGRRFAIPTHMEANAAQKCPSCGFEFGGPKSGEEEPAPGGKLKFVSGGETDVALLGPEGRAGTKFPPVTRATPLPGMARPRSRVPAIPANIELGPEVGPPDLRGAGVLYQGRDPESGESVLVRQLLPEGGQVADAERWATAATKLQGLTHPRMVAVLGVGLREGSPHAVTEKADGQTLAEVSGGRPLNLRQATKFALQIVEALTAAHGSGVLHGDLKPSNVIVDSAGGARVSDFGCAPRALEAGEPVDTPHVRGWLPFAAPEAVRDGPDAVTERSDSYGLGALLYYMLTGRPPFTGTDARTLVAEVLEGTPPSPGSLNRRVPPDMDALIMRTLEKDPAHRPSNAQAVALELRRIERQSYRYFAASERRSGWEARRWLKVFVLLVLVGGLGYGGYYLYNDLRIGRAAAQARGFAEGAREARTEQPPRLDEAVNLYRSAVSAAERTSELPKLQLELAKLFLDLDRPGDAVELLKDAALSEAGEAVEARALLPAALARAGEVEAAMTVIRGMVEAPGSERTASKVVLYAGLEAARALLGAGSASEARDLLQYLCEVAGKTGEPALGVRAALGEAYALLGEKERARRAFAGVLEATGDDEAGRSARESAALGLVRLIEPRGGGNVVDPTSPRDVEIELTAEEEEAVSASPLAQALYVRILVARGLANRAEDLIRSAKVPTAESLDVGQLEEARAWTELARGEVLEAKGKLDEARSHFARAERLSKDAPDLAEVAALAGVGLARLSLRAGRTAPALAGFRGCVERYAGKAKAAEAVAWALVGSADALRLMGEPDRAARQYREATGMMYKDQREQYLVALCGLGEVAMETRDRARMRAAWRDLAAEADAGFYGVIARAMLQERTRETADRRDAESELLQAASRAGSDLAAWRGQRRGPDFAARAYYCIALKRDLAGDLPGEDRGVREMLERAIRAAAGVSWYGIAARKRLER